VTLATMPPSRKRAGGRPKVPKPKRSIASFKGTDEFAAWFDGLIAHSRLPASILIEHALLLYAEKEGYKPKPPER
jgi:hypothetical protein